jgi:tetratricopeptide (TPR) repeat protein
MAEITFKDSNTAKSLKELVDLCETHWDEARGYLYLQTEPFRRFLEELSKETKDETYRNLAREVRTIVKENQDKLDVGMEKFLQATNLVEEPIPDVDPHEIVLDPPVPGSSASLTLRNRGRGYLYGSINTNRELEIEPKEFGVPSQGAVNIDVKLNPASKSRTKLASEIMITTNAKRRKPEIKVNVWIGGKGEPTSAKGTTGGLTPPTTRLSLLLRSMERHREVKDWYAALSDAEEVLKLDPGHSRAARVKSDAQYTLEEIDARLTSGQEAMSVGNPMEAQEQFRRVLELDPDNRVALQMIEQIKGQKRGCVALVISTAIGIGFGFWVRKYIEPDWLAIYAGYLVMSFAMALITGLFFLEKKFQGFIAALLVPLGQLTVLFGTYVLWQSWLRSVILAVTAGYLLSRQLQATFCWDIYQQQVGKLKKVWQSI